MKAVLALLPIYREQDWGWSADTADGKTHSRQLVGYQTPYTAFKRATTRNVYSIISTLMSSMITEPLNRMSRQPRRQ